MKVAIILGSIRIGRQTHKIAYYLQELLEKRGIGTAMIDLVHYKLPLMEETFGNVPDMPPVIKEVGQILMESDAMILVSPEYHGTYSGVLKNAVDYYWKEFSRKPVGVVATGSGKMGGINASTQLQHMVLSMGGYPMPLKLLVSEIQEAFDDEYHPLNDTVVKNTRKFLDEFTWFSEAITAARQLQVNAAG